MMSVPRSTGVLASAAVVLVVSASAAGAVTVDEIKARGTIEMISFPFPTSEFVRPEGDGYAGLDVDVVTAFAKTLGVALEVVPVGGYGELIPALRAGRGDLVGSSFTITAEREALVDFSNPYFPSITQVVARKGSALRSVGDLAGARAASVPGSSLERRLDALGVDDRLAVPSSADQFTAVSEGRAAFAIADSTSVISDLPDYPALEVVFNLPGVQEYGFAFREDSADLREAFDEHLRKLRETGYLYQLVRRHFGDRGVELFELAKQQPR